MYSYKLNNSYTVYVNYVYINECIKASRKQTHRNAIGKRTEMKNTVQIGSKVDVVDLDTQERETFTLDCIGTINSINKVVSNKSPIGRALLGHKVGEIITVKAPAGDFKYKILDLRC